MSRRQKAEVRSQKWIAFAITTTFFLLSSPLCLAKNGAYKSTRHGHAAAGPQRRNEFPRGSCEQCHDGTHGSHSSSGQAYEKSLFAPNNNDLCFTCHSLPSADGVFSGSAPWLQGTHARSPNVYTPGPNGRSSADANKCLNCHDPHGTKDNNGVIPTLLPQRESALCGACHDGSRARDIARDFTKTYRHPVGLLKHHTGEDKPKAFADRHSECVDCHNAHVAGADPAPPSPPQASNRLAGVSRVQVANGGAGAVPNYVFRPADDTSPVNEYEICFKCHSSYTVQRAGQSDLALLTNPNNRSFHPIQAAGTNPNIDSRAFAGAYTAQSMIFCSDCHGSDEPDRRGPHGSVYQYLLKKPVTTAVGQSMTQFELCFDCHRYAVYADPSSRTTVHAFSRFAGDKGHSFHVGAQHVPCYGCHETHGSARYPALIARRAPGLLTYTQTTDGGTCTASCHSRQTYKAEYAR